MPARYIFSFLVFLLLLSGLLPVHAQRDTVAPKEYKSPGGLRFSMRIVADSLDDPWNIIYGKDNHLWITEAKGYRVLRLDPSNGYCDTLFDLNDARLFPRYDTLQKNVGISKPWPQGGLMGMAMHPDFDKDKPFVYLAYLYDYEGKKRSGDGFSKEVNGYVFTTRLVRFSYDSAKRKLIQPSIICDTIPGSNDHNSGRMIIAQIDSVPYLFYTVGDMGAGQYKNAGRTNHAQHLDSYEGKVLRFNLEPVVGNDSIADWIPADNPFNGSRKSAIWSLGHRNAQGLTVMNKRNTQIIIASEHGPFSDDEINIIRRSGNYGHPLVVGYADGNYNGLAAGVTKIDSLPGEWNTSYPLIKDEKKNAAAILNYTEPIYSFEPTSVSKIRSVMKRFKDFSKWDRDWVSLAPSGLFAYQHEAIPAWKNSLLITSLKNGKIIRAQLDSGLEKVLATEELFQQSARFRDITVSTDGRRFYITTDESVSTSGPTANNRTKQSIHGAVIEYTLLDQ